MQHSIIWSPDILYILNIVQKNKKLLPIEVTHSSVEKKQQGQF